MELVQPLPRVIVPAQTRRLPRAPSWARWSIGVMAKVAPSLTVDQLYKLYFQPQRYHATPEQRAILSDSTPFEETVAGHRIVRYVWDRSDYPWEAPPLKTVLLVHGWAGASSQMTPFVQPLLRAGYRVVAFDAPAHGRAPGQRTNFVKMSEVIRELAHSQPIDGIVAHSLGATAVLHALQRGLDVPKLALLSTGTAIETYPRRFAEAAGAPELGASLLWRIHAEFGDDVIKVAEHEALRSVTTPTLLLHDIDDGEAPYTGAAQLAQTLRNATLATTAGLGHRRILSDAAVLETVTRFLG